MEEERELQRRQVGAPRNASSVPYDPLTLAYAESTEGEILRYADDQIRYRAALRAQHLDLLQSADGYDPVTGQPRRQLHLPPKPELPDGVSREQTEGRPAFS